MKYKVGDRVRIKPKFHFCSVDGFNNTNMKDEFFNEYSRLPYCETVMTIGIVNKDFYILKEDRWAYKWTDEMIEGLVEEETLIERVDDKGLPFNEWLSHKGSFHVPDGYELKDENGNVINATKIVLEKKKKEYPKTYEECCKVLGIDALGHNVDRYKWKILATFQNLIICRDAYWKIAGNEMGLGKPWAPDWNNVSDKYCIYFVSGYAWSKECQTRQCPFAFPTPEMRDAFKENFDPDIEFCKELL